MSNVFDINRFGKYFLYDLRNAKRSYWLSLIIAGCLPIFSFVVVELIARFTTGAFINAGIGTQLPAMVIAYTIVVFTFPVKAYGRLTEKGYGSSWIMIPASPFEKWLSMIIVTCVVLPLCFLIILFCADGLLSVLFPACWPKPVPMSIHNLNEMLIEEADGIISFNWPAIIYVSWVESILCFTLGAIVFKKAKVGKTFLALFVIGSICSWITTLIFGITHLTAGDFSLITQDADALKLFSNFNLMVALACALYVVGAGGGMYYRIKTMKH